MQLCTESPQDLAESAAALQHAGVGRTPFYLQSGGEPLFAWLHAVRGADLFDHGVLICAPIGVEQLHANRTLRHLADTIAKQGIATVRFDWHGTGDSAGSDADPSRRATWHCNVRDVVAWMRTQLSCRRISVVGLRMGAMLAVEALEHDRCEGLVLWAPVVSGKSYVRQLRAIEQLSENRVRPVSAAPGDIEAGGFLIAQETAEQLAESNLLVRRPECSRALIVGPTDKRLVEQFARWNIPSEFIIPPGYAEMMAEPHASQVPQQAIRAIAAWLGAEARPLNADVLTLATEKELTLCQTSEFRDGGPKRERACTAILPRLRFGLVSRLTRKRNFETPALNSCESDETAPGCRIRERLLQIGPDDLFGVLSQPIEAVAERPAVIFLNAGSSNHVGPGRLYVELARYLAGTGFPCLRLDVSGLGDSISRCIADENNPYPATVFRDVSSAARELQSRFGVQRCVLLGLCSGAYGAFQSAVQLADPCIVESILINPLTFYWRDGLTLDASTVARQVKENCALARATSIPKLWKFLRGKTQFGYWEAARVLVRRLCAQIQQLSIAQDTEGDFRPIEVAAHPTEQNLSGDLSQILAAGRRLAMFLAEGDPGYVIMSNHARRRVRSMVRAGTLQITTIANADHTFSRRAPRQKLVHAIADHLIKRYATNSPVRVA